LRQLIYFEFMHCICGVGICYFWNYYFGAENPCGYFVQTNESLVLIEDKLRFLIENFETRVMKIF